MNESLQYYYHFTQPLNTAVSLLCSFPKPGSSLSFRCPRCWFHWPEMLTILALSLQRSARGHRESMSCLPKEDWLLFRCLAWSLAWFLLARSTLVCFTILLHFQLSKHQENLPFVNFQRHRELSLWKKGQGDHLRGCDKIVLGIWKEYRQVWQQGWAMWCTHSGS